MTNKILTRDEFREGVFRRDGYKCVICGEKEGLDAHHIIERRLFDNGGYLFDNGATLCSVHHLQAEQTVLSCEDIRKACGIKKIILPEHLYSDYEYDKWGNIVNPNGTRIKGELFYDESVQKVLKSGLGCMVRFNIDEDKSINLFSDYVKYPRTYHLPFSPGRTEDDKTLPDCSIFEGRQVVVSIKMDGESFSGYSDGYTHARSLDSNNHVSRNWVKNFIAPILFNLPKQFRICGENLYAKHSIYYKNLESYFYLFSIWDDKNNCLSWDETIEWAALLGLTVVPVIYRGVFNLNKIQNAYQDYLKDNPDTEGFVIRNEDSFSYGNFRKNVGKFVRKEHVVDNQHWIKQKIVKNELAS